MVRNVVEPVYSNISPHQLNTICIDRKNFVLKLGLELEILYRSCRRRFVRFFCFVAVGLRLYLIACI
jgi:hypothetical protein